MERGQISLEMGVALAAAFILLLGSLIIFGWMNSRLVFREERYEAHPTMGRVAAGLSAEAVLPDEDAQLLDIFAEEEE
ncbi:MAG: hypothetical protein MJA29_05085 [Candidatus Omnitrophica bacterium]|nr:hypothetical protein [Candidatus Omnitrophota bacterium]